METAATVTRIAVLAAAARRLRRHYKKRLVALYALPADPYEPEEEAVEALHLVIVLYPPVGARQIAPFKYIICHCEERSDVAISLV